MGSRQRIPHTRDALLLSTVYFGFYFAVFGFLALDHRLLAQIRPVAFHYNRDLEELALIGGGVPRLMIGHPWIFGVADMLAFLLPVTLLIHAIRHRRFSPWLGWLFTGYLTLYLLLADIFWQVHLEPFVLYILLSFAFITNRPERFYPILAGCRYYFLYVFASAAIWKLTRGAVFNGNEMSRILLVHHSDLLSGDCTGWACRMYSWLIDHPFPAQLFYLAGVALEAAFFIGFFTRRYDRLLLALAVVFVAADLIVMRIPYWTILLGGVTLWLDTRPPLPGIVVYETTHHENLPALLDCCELHFPRVVVFCKDISYRNISGRESLGARWPKTEFVVQSATEPNRAFIGRLFGFLRRHRYSHLHLSTLDNNLLLFAFRLGFTGRLHVSLTVHEVNEYFTYPLASVRDWTESLAKMLLHRQIRHYTFFLPAMASQFRERMPHATAVFIPSRFYVSLRPSPATPPAASPHPIPAPPAQPTDTASPFTIVIPGSVDPNRRDYAFVVECFRSWQPPRSVRLVILGDSDTAYGREITTQLRQLEGFRLQCYTGYVPETVYEAEISGADLLWSPLHVHKKGSRNSPETYGLTTASGLTADLLLNNAPALTPAAFVLDEPFRAALLPYASTQEATAHLHRLMTDVAFHDRLRKDIDAAFSLLTKEHFKPAFEKLTASDQER